MKRIVLGLFALALLRADMYPDASNAKLPEAQENLGIAPSMKSYGAKGDVAIFGGGAVAAGSAGFTSGWVTFTQADVGKRIVINGAGTAGAPHATTIAAVTSGSDVTLAAPAVTAAPTSTPTRAPPATVAGGTGYAVGNTITLTDGSVLTVLSITGSAVKNAWVSTPAIVATPPVNPVAQASSSGAGTGATFNLTWTTTGQGYYGTADGAAINAALTASDGIVAVPAGGYCIDQQLEMPTTKAVSLVGSGKDAATLYACAPMTAVVHRASGFGYGGGVRDLSVDAYKLADHAVYTEGGLRAVYSGVIGLNAKVAEWRCGNGTVQVFEQKFTGISGATQNNVFRPSQRSTYNFWSNATSNGCTDSIVDGNSTFNNASAANIFDDAGGMNTYASPHVYGYPTVSFYADYGIRCNGPCNISNPLLDGANLAAVYLAGYKHSLMGGVGQWVLDSQGAAAGVLIATGVANSIVTGVAVTGTNGVLAAKAVVQVGTAEPTTIVANNPGAGYSTALRTHTNFTAGAPGAATGYLTLYDAAGTAYKVPVLP